MTSSVFQMFPEFHHPTPLFVLAGDFKAHVLFLAYPTQMPDLLAKKSRLWRGDLWVSTSPKKTVP